MALLSAGLATVGVLATSGISEAHDRNVSATCYQLQVSFSQYTGPAANNVLTVTIDGVAQAPVTFAESYSNTYTWNPSLAHTYTVSVDANALSVPPDNTFDTTDSDVTQPCVDTSSTSSSTSTSTSSSTTTAPGATTTTLPSTTTTSSGGAGGPAGSTTTAPATSTTSTVRPTTTSAVGNRAPTVTRAATSSGSLPATGGDTGAQLTLAMAVLLAGAGLVAITRRRAGVAEEG